MIPVIRLKKYSIEAIVQLYSETILRCFVDCLDYTNFLKNNKIDRVVSVRRKYKK